MKIVVVGDSFTFGQGCSDAFPVIGKTPSAYSWPSLLQQYLPNSVVDNRAIPGNNNMTMFESLYQELTTDINTIIFCASFAMRIAVRVPDYEEFATLSISPHWSTESTELGFNDAIANYYKHLYSDRVGYNTAATAVMAAYGCARLVGADFFWSKPANQQPTTTNKIFDHLAPYQFMSSTDFEYTDIELESCRHPNNAGHARYFKQVIMPLLQL